MPVMAARLLREPGRPLAKSCLISVQLGICIYILFACLMCIYIYNALMPMKFECYCTSLRQAARAISQKYDAALRGTDLTITQFTLLKMLAEMRQPRVNDLAEALTMDQTTLSRTLRIMERDGLITPIAPVAGDDKRERRFVLSPRGQQRFKRATPLWRAAQRSVEKLLGSDAERVSSAAYELSVRLGD
jgi:DNA-binding MarR family transcriptional regulator